jgi:tetratricopeptide (TPR) repeat protein
MRLKLLVLASVGLAIVTLGAVLNFDVIHAQDQQPFPAVMEYMKDGSAFFLKNDFKSAIGPYSTALELEKKQSSLPKTLWYVLVDNLGMAYGITGDLKKAKDTFEYGLSKDDKYPLFYYNLACTYAEMNDLENTIVQLKRAFEYRQNILPGESMPDPATDDSFQRFMQNKRFLAALNELKKAGNNF